ncbi:MAG: carbon starvation protein A [Kiritimatiellaeota bacterium]|nr:carbon starvation protein A [Kiritimatiellota bacterium]
MVAALFLAGCAIFFIGYRYYGRKLQEWFGMDPARPTPAQELTDGIDYVPTKSQILFGHHFSSIAGAGPIVGPILAGIAFGWLPALVWILIGAIFVGGVHDYAALMASVRHRGRSVGELCREYLSPLTYRVFLVFVWFALVYVLIVFMDLTASTFAPAAAAKAALGGAVATASLLYILIALLFGLCLYRFKISFRTASFIFVPLVFAALFAGHWFPILPSRVPTICYGDPKYTWTAVLLVYCFVASVAPVWILLQPRDYLSSFLLFACLIGGGLGLVIAGATGHAAVSYPSFLGWSSSKAGLLFPGLFITVACGAVSGFHSMVASGTTAKQLDNERSALPVAYGGMLIEGVLALIALAAVMVLTRSQVANHPAQPTLVFANAIGTFCVALGIPAAVGENFGLLAVSTFLLTTLDTSTRLSRFVIEEFFGVRDRRWRYLTTAATLALPALVVFARISNPKAPGTFIPAWKVVWPAFGTTNQLLAGLTLLVVFVWLTSKGRKTAFLVLPMFFMLVTTGVSLVLLSVRNLGGSGQPLIGVISAGLFVLALLVVVDTALHWSRIRGGGNGFKPEAA